MIYSNIAENQKGGRDMSNESILGVVLAKLDELIEAINLTAKVGWIGEHPPYYGTDSIRLGTLLTILKESQLGESGRIAVLQKLGELNERCSLDWVVHDIGYTVECIRDS